MKRLSIILILTVMMLSLSACNDDTSTITDDNNFYYTDDTTMAEYASLYHTWYSEKDVIEFATNGEFFLNDNSNDLYIKSGYFTITDDKINVTIYTDLTASEIDSVTSYYFDFTEDYLVLTNINDDTDTTTYYADQAQLGDSD